MVGLKTYRPKYSFYFGHKHTYYMKYAVPVCVVACPRAVESVVFDRLPAFPYILSLIPTFIEEVLFLFPVFQASSDAIYLARHVGLRVGVPKETPALTLNRLCGSGFQSIVTGCQVRARTRHVEFSETC